MKRSNRLVLLIGAFLAVVAFVLIAISADYHAGGLIPRTLASARMDMDVSRTPDGWTITERVSFTKDTEAAIQAHAGPVQFPNASPEPSALDVTAAAVAENAPAGWKLVETLDQYPVFERTRTIPYPDSADSRAGWSTDEVLPVSVLHVAGVDVVAGDGSTARIAAPPRLIVATVPVSAPADQLNGTVQWDLKLDSRDQQLLVRVAPGWARDPARAPLFRWITGDPVGSVVSQIGAAVLSTLIVALLAFFAWKGGLWRRIQGWRGRWTKSPAATTGREWSSSMTRDQRYAMQVQLLDGFWSPAGAHPTDEKIARFGAELAVACVASPNESVAIIAKTVYDENVDVRP